MNYKQKSKDWYTRSLQENDEFVKFILLYIALEVGTKLKFSKIREIKNDHSIRNIFYDNIKREYLEVLKNELNNNPLLNMDPNGDDRWSGKLNAIDDFEGIIEFIIRSRNNLFHGDKALDEKRDIFIVQKGNMILQPLVEAILL